MKIDQLVKKRNGYRGENSPEGCVEFEVNSMKHVLF